MGILGLTTEEDPNATYNVLGAAFIKCYKGARKSGSGSGTRPGADLNQKIRLVTSHSRAVKILRELYAKADPEGGASIEALGGDLLVESLNIYLALNDIEKTFESSMKSFDGSGLKFMCDRATIYKEAVNVETYRGKRRILRDCDRACPLKGTDDWDCPNECKPNAILHFYVREMYDLDLVVHAQFETKAYGDISNLTKRLKDIFKEIGSVARSPYPCYWTKHRIPLILTRVKNTRKRPDFSTGKKSAMSYWDLDIQVDPVWMDWYRKQSLMEDLMKRGLQPSKATVIGLMTGGEVSINIDAIAVEDIPALPEAYTRTTTVASNAQPETVEVSEPTILVSPRPTEKKAKPNAIALLMAAFEQNGWTEDAIAALQQHCQISDLESINEEQRIELQFIAMNSEAAREWNALALSPGTVTVIPSNLTKADWAQHIHPVCLKYGWVNVRPDGETDNTQIVAMLKAEYGITRIGELQVDQIPEILELLASDKVRDRWLKTPN